MKNKQASRLIYGSYGTGKSHLMYLLVFGKTKHRKSIFNFIEKVECIDNELAKDIRNYLDNSSPLL